MWRWVSIFRIRTGRVWLRPFSDVFYFSFCSFLYQYNNGCAGNVGSLYRAFSASRCKISWFYHKMGRIVMKWVNFFFFGLFPPFRRVCFRIGSTFINIVNKIAGDCRKTLRRAGYLYYTGAFITDWEVPIEPKSPGEGPRADFIVDWIN